MVSATLQRLLLRTRVFQPKFVVRIYVAAAASTSILFGDVATTAGIVGILCAAASLSGWVRVFPVFMCYVVVFWLTRCSLMLAGHYDPVLGIGDMSVLLISMSFAFVSFAFFIASSDRIVVSDGVDDVRLSHCVGAIIFGVIAYVWPLYLSEFRRLPTPIALSVAGVISDMFSFGFFALLCKPLAYVRREGER